MTKETKEWNIKTSWGKIAMISWGDPSKRPILLVHGYMDNAATFTYLVHHLSNEYYCVAFDLPGHGRSDPFPPGPLVSQAHMVHVVRIVIEHLQWKSFIYLAHSMSAVIGATYNTVYPDEITHMVFLDPGLSLNPYYQLYNEPEIWYLRYHYYYENNYGATYNTVYPDEITHMVFLDPGLSLNPYYQLYNEPEIWYLRYHYYYENNYGKTPATNPKLYKYDHIVSSMAKKRKLSKGQAETVLSRSLVPVGDKLYRLSWDPRMVTITSLVISEDTLLHIKFNNPPPTLVTIGTDDPNPEEIKNYSKNILNKYTELKNCFVHYLIGPHDMHITSADKMAMLINEFLKKEFCDPVSKL